MKKLPKQEIQHNLVYSNVNATTYEQAAEFMLAPQNEAFRRFGKCIASVLKLKQLLQNSSVVGKIDIRIINDVGAEGKLLNKVIKMQY